MRLGFGVLGFVALAAVGCAAAPSDGAATSTANDTTATTSGPLALDATLSLGAGAPALSAAARADGTIAVTRKRTGQKADTIVTLVKSDGSGSSDVTLPGAANANVALTLAHNDGIVVAGGGKSFFLARIGADGALDPKFRPEPLNIDVADAATTKDGQIVIAGTLKSASKAVVVRLKATGAIDTAFAGGMGAWVDDATAPAATHAVVDASGAITFITVGANGTNALRLDASGKLDATYGKSGRASIAAVQPKHGSALLAGEKGAVTYISSSATSDDNSAFALDATGAVTGTTAVAGEIDGATSSGLESYVVDGDACTLHIGETTATLTAAQCSAPAPYTTLPDGRHAIVTSSDSGVSVLVYAP